MSGTMPSALQNIISFNPHKNHIRYSLLLAPFYIQENKEEKWKDYTGPVYSSTLRYPFHVLF